MPTATEENEYNGLRFAFADIYREIEAMRRLAAKYLERESLEFVLEEWRRTLEHLQLNPAKNAQSWQIPTAKPLRTELSEGAYQKDRLGHFTVFAELSCVWEIEVEARAARARATHFILSGNASTTVSVFDYATSPVKLLARWNFDIGANTSPGCHFHAQVPWETGGHSFDVPRLPILVVTPMDALEFILAELFQDDWPRDTMGRAGECGWSAIQRKRLTQLCEWQLAQFNTVTSGSPWTVFKNAGKPRRDLFI